MANRTNDFSKPIPVADGGTGAIDAADARANLGITIGARAVLGTVNQIDVTNSDGLFGNPTISLAANTTIPGNGVLNCPIGATSERPTTPNVGMIRGNSDTNTTEIYSNGDWQQITSSSITAVNVQIFTASGVYNPTPGMKFCVVEVVGSGGGGGGVTSAPNSSAAAGGGGAGAYAKSTLTAAEIGVSQIVTVATGGAGGLAGNNNGQNGSSSSLGILVSADGGGGGFGANHSNQFGYGVYGAGGGSGVGNIVINGNNGGLGQSFGSNNLGYGGIGGNSFYGTGGEQLINLPGANGFNYGSGGSGASSGNTGDAHGGNGSNGVVIITEYIV